MMCMILIVIYSLCEDLIAVCPVKGQIRKECASLPSCHRRCNSADLIACPKVCVENGCECPEGTVIDEVINECVAPSQCSGTHNMFRSSYM